MNPATGIVVAGPFEHRADAVDYAEWENGREPTPPAAHLLIGRLMGEEC